MTLITENMCEHVWVEGAAPTTCGQKVVIYCGLCGLVRPSSGSIFSGVVQGTLEGWATLKSAEDASGGLL